MTTKITLNNIADTALATLTGPKVTTIVYPGTETATDVVGGATINLTGGGFQSGCSVLVASTASSVVTFISSTQISFIAPALSAGTYVIYVINPDGGTAISIPGVSYSGTPNWTTTAGTLGNAYETGAISATLTATGDAPITYTLATGTLPTGSTLASNGTLSGTAVATASATTYTFAVTAKDAQNQTTNRSFSLTINPDVVTWVTPADSTTYTVTKDSAISNVTLSATSAAGGSITYTADTLPTGLSITGANIAGTPTIAANTSTTLTATSTATRAATRTINWVVNVGNDPFFKYTTLLLQGASTTFVDDASTNNFAVTIHGDTKPNSFNPYTPGYYSNYFDGTGDYLATTSTQIIPASTTYTVEAWVYLTGDYSDYREIVTQGSVGNANRWLMYIEITTGILRVQTGSSNINTSFTVPKNTWAHLAVVNNNGSYTVYANGTSVASGSNSVTPQNTYVTVGAFQNANEFFQGYISNVRITNTAVYTSAFTPSTTPLTAISGTTLLTCQSNRFIDNSTNNFTLTVNGNTSISSFDPFVPNTSYSTYGSGYFDGTGDYLSVPSNAAFALGTGDFTLEGWIYVTAAFGTSGSGRGAIISNRTAASGNTSFVLQHYNGNINFGTVSTDVIVGTTTMSINRWYHVAITRSSGTVRLFLNGVSDATAVTGNTTNFSDTSAVYIGIDGSYSSLYPYTGYITDTRIVKGTAVYTTAFTPPSAPLTAVGNTQLLTLQNNQPVNNSTFLDNSTNNFLVTRVGNTTQGTFSPYGGNWSNYFDGTGDFLTAPAGSGTLATGNFTVEGWIYCTANPSGFSTIFSNYSSSGPTAFAIFSSFNSNNRITLYVGGSTAVVGSTTIVYNSWTHIAAVRNSGVTTLYINGVSQGTVSYSGSSSGDGIARIGCAGDAPTATNFQGYISNSRWVIGTAVYTANFTPSTTPLTTISGTSLLTCQSNRLIDTSINNYTITKNGDTSVQRFSPFNPLSLVPTSYGWNLYTSGSFQVQTVTKNRTLSSLSTGAFTVEGWYYPTSSISSQNARIISLGRDSAGSNTSWDLYISNGSALVWQRINTTATTYSANYTFNLNTWYHVVACRDGSSNLALFVNGTRILLQASETTNYDYVTSSNDIHYIGATYNGSVWSYALGYYSNIRIIKGATAYDPTQSTLTVPTTQLPVTAQTSMLLFSNTGADLAGNYPLADIYRGDAQSKMSTFNPFGYTSATTTGYSVSTIGGSAYFDGTGDTLSIPAGTYLQFTGNYTIEFWIYFTSVAGTQDLIANFVSNAAPDWTILISPSFQYYPSSAASYVNGPTPVANRWYHVAAVRSGTTCSMYIDGVSVGTPLTFSGTLGDATRPAYIGSRGGSSGFTNGYMSDVRITKSAVYTNNFIPPTAPLTAIQNSTLLLSMTSAGISDAAMMNNLETIGDAKLSHAVSKFGGTSMSFDGTGDGLFRPSSDLYNFGASNFTIAFWIYFNSKTGYQTIISSGYTPNTANGWVAQTGNGDGKIIFYRATGSSASVIVADTGSTVNTGQWYHIAIVRSGSTTTIYRDGASVGSGGDTNTYSASASCYIGGGSSVGFDGFFLNGYIDDLRITKGYARYTANFTAPTSEFKPF